MKKLSDEKLYDTINSYFTKYLDTMKKSSKNTIRSYRKALSDFIDWTAADHECSIFDITFKMLDDKSLAGYLQSIEDNGDSITTRNQRLQAIRSFFSYAAKMDPAFVIYYNNILKVPAKKDLKLYTIDYLRENELKILFQQPDQGTYLGYRDLFIMILMYDSAARVQEIVDVKICDIKDYDTPIMLLHGKGNKDRTVPLMKSTMKHFHKYMDLFHPGVSNDSDEYLFYSVIHGEARPLDTSTIRKMMIKYGNMAKEKCPSITVNVHPHLLRHSRAMHLRQHGMSLALISEWLGHSDPRTTLIYAHADTEEKRKAIEKATPANSVIRKSSTMRYKISDEDMLKKLYGLK